MGMWSNGASRGFRSNLPAGEDLSAYRDLVCGNQLNPDSPKSATQQTEPAENLAASTNHSGRVTFGILTSSSD